MTELYSDINKQSWVSAPGFVRQRNRFRGQRESAKLNAEIGAFRYDVARLYEKCQTINDYLNFTLLGMVEGGSVNAQYLTATDTVPALENFTFPGINPLALRALKLEKMIRNLEKPR